MNNEEMSKALMSPEDQAEYDKLLQQGSGFVGGRKKGFYIPTIKLNNSDKTLKKTGIALGNFFLREKKGEEEFITDMGEDLKGVILKVSYSINSIFDPSGQVNYYSYEFDNFFEDEITVIDSSSKEILHQGSYKQWKEDNQIKSSRGSKNDFNLQVHLYILKDGSFEDQKVYRLTFAGKSMSEWFAYTNGDKQRGIESIYSQGIHPHNAIHNFASIDEVNPKGEKYWYIGFSVDTKLSLDSLRKVVAMQQELGKQIDALRNRRGAEEVEEKPEAKRLKEPDNSPVRDDEVVKEPKDDDEVKIEDVPF